ncbi:MAG TPA: ribonuclease III [Balneolaceae bacterium]|nr:ribonuclease III [Balneolaceae bacterium]
MFEKLRSYLNRQPKISSEYASTIEKLESILEIKIDNPFLFIRALRHRSTLTDNDFGKQESYERLEFLGDAVLDLIVSEIIFDEYPKEDEGFLTKLRAKLVKGDALASYSRQLGLSSIMLVGRRAQGQGIEFSKSALADVFESLIGAIYIDKGYKDAAKFINRVFGQYVDIKEVSQRLDNYKSMLLEYAQARQLHIPYYKVIGESGPAHNKTFRVVAIVDGQERGEGTGKTKKQAEQQAARQTLQKLK